MTLSLAKFRYTISRAIVSLIALLPGCHSISTRCIEIRTTQPSMESARSGKLEENLLADVDIVAKRWSFREDNTPPVAVRRYRLDQPMDGKQNHISIEARIRGETLRVCVKSEAEQFRASEASQLGDQVFSDLMQEIGRDLADKGSPAACKQ